MARNPLSKKRKLTDAILFSLEKAIDGYMRIEDFTYHSYRYQHGIPDLKKSDLAKALKRLRKNGFIDLMSDKDLIWRLTDKGRERVVLEKLWTDDSPWDGKWRIVIFDIPEKRRVARDLLRYRLKSWGFTPWQQSVWVTKKNCTNPLRDYIKKIGIEDWVMVIESDNIGR